MRTCSGGDNDEKTSEDRFSFAPLGLVRPDSESETFELCKQASDWASSSFLILISKMAGERVRYENWPSPFPLNANARLALLDLLICSIDSRIGTSHVGNIKWP